MVVLEQNGDGGLYLNKIEGKVCISMKKQEGMVVSEQDRREGDCLRTKWGAVSEQRNRGGLSKNKVGGWANSEQGGGCI